MNNPRHLTPRQVRSIVKGINEHKAGIAAHRDALREIISDIEAITDNCDSAVNDLEGAADTLSQYL